MLDQATLAPFQRTKPARSARLSTPARLGAGQGVTPRRAAVAAPRATASAPAPIQSSEPSPAPPPAKIAAAASTPRAPSAAHPASSACGDGCFGSAPSPSG